MTTAFADRELVELLEHDMELLAIADAISDTQRSVARPSRNRKALLVAVAAVMLVAAPAYALVRVVIDFNSSPPASALVVKQFSYLDATAPEGMNPNVLSGSARKVSSFALTDGSTVVLSVAPTKSGGFCEDWGKLAETCDASRTTPMDLGAAAWRIPQGPAFVFGDVLSQDAVRVELRWAYGRLVRVPLTRVSTPIEASFFFYALDVAGDNPTSAVALDPSGTVVAEQHLGQR
jgi:hypothetical protein